MFEVTDDFLDTLALIPIILFLIAGIGMFITWIIEYYKYKK